MVPCVSSVLSEPAPSSLESSLEVQVPYMHPLQAPRLGPGSLQVSTHFLLGPQTDGENPHLQSESLGLQRPPFCPDTIKSTLGVGGALNFQSSKAKNIQRVPLGSLNPLLTPITFLAGWLKEHQKSRVAQGKSEPLVLYNVVLGQQTLRS